MARRKPAEILASMEALPILYTYEDKVRFNEVDKHGAVNNPIYLSLIQDARIDYLQSVGINPDEFMPVVKTAFVDYVKPLADKQKYRIEIRAVYEKPFTVFHTCIFETEGNSFCTYVEQEILFANASTRRPVVSNILNLDAEGGKDA